MALEDEIKRQTEALNRLMDKMGGGGFRSSFGGGADIGKEGADLQKDLKDLSQQAVDVENNIKKLNKQFLPFTGSLQKAREASATLERDINRINERMEELDTALETGRYRNKEINDATRDSLKAEKDKLKAVKATVDFEGQKRESVGNVFNALGNISNAYQEIARASVAGMQQITSAVVAGGSGFNLLGAAAEYQADMAKAQSNMGAAAMQSVGQSMQGLGIAGQMAGGALNFLAQQVQHNAELRRAAASIRNNLFMQMGEKFSKSFMTAAGAGAHFANGADGMNKALNGSRITMAEFGEFIKRNNEKVAASGMSFEEFTKRVGATSAAFKKSGLDNALMRMGLGYEQQSDLMADTISGLEQLASGAGKGSASQKEIEQATLNAAKAQITMAGLLGEEAEQRKKQNAEKLKELNSQIVLTDLTKKYGLEYGAAQESIMKGMNGTEAAIMREMMASGGQVRDAGLNVFLESNPAMKARMQETYSKMMSGQLKSNDDYLKLKAKTAKDEEQQALRNKEYASAAVLSNNKTLNDTARYNAETIAESRKFEEKKVAEEIAKRDKVVPKTPDAPVPKPPEDKLGTAIVNAADTMNTFQKDMETYVINNLPAWSAAMQDALKKMKDAYQGKVAGLNPLADKFAWLTEFMQKYGLVIMLAVQAIAMLMTMAKLASSALGKLGAAGEMAKLKKLKDKPKTVVGKDGRERYAAGTEIGGKKVGGQYVPKDQLQAPGGDIAKKGMFARGREALGTDDPDSKLGKMNATKLAKFAGPAMVAMNVVGGVMDFMSGQKKYEEAKAAGDKEAMKEARAEQGEGVGGAIGGAAGGAIGFALGGPIGAAVGSYLGEMAGGALGKYIGPYWDDMSKKAGEMWTSTREAVSKGWDSFTTGFGNVMSSMWKGIKEGWQWLKDMFSTIGKAIWTAIQNTPLFKLGSFIIGGITSAASGMATAMINGLKSAFDWMKNAISNIIPDWMKNAANKVGNAVTAAYDYVTGNDKPAAPPPQAQPGRSAAGKVDAKPAPAPGTAEPSLSKEQLENYAYSIYLGKNKITDVPAKYQAQVSAMVKNPPPHWKPAGKPAQPQSPPVATNKTQTATQDAGKQGENKRPDPGKQPAPATEKSVAAKPPEVAKGGQVTEKDIPRLLQENLKMAEYQAKGTQRMVDILAAISENSRRTTSATEKMSRQS